MIFVLKYINLSIIIPPEPIFDVPKQFLDDQKIIEKLSPEKKCLGSPPSIQSPHGVRNPRVLGGYPKMIRNH